MKCLQTIGCCAGLLLAAGCYVEPFAQPIAIPASYVQGPDPVSPASRVTTQATAPQSQPTTAQIPTLTEAQRDQVGKDVETAVFKKYPAVREGKLSEYLVLVGSLVSIGQPRIEGDYSYVLLDTNEPLSMAIHPRTVAVSRGLMKQMMDESELAGVLSRELSNLQSQRIFKAAGYALSAPATRPTTRPALSPAEKESASAATGRILAMLTRDGLGDAFERTADLEGARLAAEARYAPDGFLRLLTRQKPTSAVGGNWERIRALDANVAIIAKANPQADVKLPVRFEAFVKKD